jgi:hypothetical protein
MSNLATTCHQARQELLRAEAAAKARCDHELAEAKRKYEDRLQQVHEAHGEAPLSPKGNESNFFARQLSMLGERLDRLEAGYVQQGSVLARCSSVSVSPRTVRRLRQTYCEQTTISPDTSARLQASYDKALDERADLVLSNLDTPPSSPPRSQESDGEWEGTERREAAMAEGLRGYVNCDGELLPLSQAKTPIRKGRVLFPEEPEPESEVVAPDPQLAAVGGAGGASSVDGA